jgi:ketosteroid isomerase-like protein
MSQENLEIVRAIWAPWERGDFSAVGWADPQIEWVIADGPAQGSWSGLAGMAASWSENLSPWKELRAEADELRLLDDGRVLVLFHFSARGKGSGLEVGGRLSQGASIYSLRDGKVIRLVTYWDRERALEAAGLRESPMSQQNVDAARAQYERWNAGDFEAWIAAFDPEVEYFSSVTALLFGQGDYRGHEGLREFVAQYLESWGHFRLEPQEFIAVGDRVVVVAHAIGRGRGSGATVEHDMAHVWSFRDGLPIRHESYLSREAAFKAVGLRE